jgi:hypothetical protein
MIAKSFLSLPLLALAACAANGEPAGDRGLAQAAQTGTAVPSIFALLAQQTYTLPADIPDDLTLVTDVLRPHQMASLLDGVVVGAWTTSGAASGADPALVYRCVADANGDSTWQITPDAGLTPMGLDAEQLAAALPFTAAYGAVAKEGLYLYSPSGPAWTVDGPLGTGASALDLHVQLIGKETAEADSPNADSIPQYLYGKASGVASSFVSVLTIARADYVLELNTQGGLGPDDEGAPCDAGADDVRASFTADFYFVTAPW